MPPPSISFAIFADASGLPPVRRFRLFSCRRADIDARRISLTLISFEPRRFACALSTPIARRRCRRRRASTLFASPASFSCQLYWLISPPSRRRHFSRRRFFADAFARGDERFRGFIDCRFRRFCRYFDTLAFRHYFFPLASPASYFLFASQSLRR